MDLKFHEIVINPSGWREIAAAENGAPDAMRGEP
jgi:hypothetical protein